MQIVTSPPKNVMYNFLFSTCFWSAAATAELWLAFR